MLNFKKLINAASAFYLISASTSFGYSGEDVLDGLPFHHYDITLRALAGDEAGGAMGRNFGSIGFSKQAAQAVAWHADYIDSYLYSPIWWSDGFSPKGAIKRIKAAFSQYPHLVKLHFDDTFSTQGIEDTWKRYGNGTLAGLEWAYQQNDVAAAYNVLGVSVHAVQDFYSHSNWIDDPDRRNTTWMASFVKDRRAAKLYTGSYDLPRIASQHSHGKVALDCTVLKQSENSNLIDTICSGASPFSNTGACETHRHCISDQQPTTINVHGEKLKNALILHPPGIALDSSLLAPIASAERKITDSAGRLKVGNSRGLVSMETCTAISNFGMDCETDERVCQRRNSKKCETDADRVFGTAKYLAIENTQQWVKKIGEIFSSQDARHAAFWKRIEGGEATGLKSRIAQFEDFTKVPFQFLSVGPYPVGNAEFDNRLTYKTADGHYLRLDIETADNAGAGTDSSIYARVEYDGGRSGKFILDYMPTNDKDAGARASRLLAYNDFERGDRTVYTIGPFPKTPTALELGNDAADAGDVLDALADDFVTTMTDIGSGLGRTALAVIGGNADFVGEKTIEFTFDDLVAAAGESGHGGRRSIVVDGGKEGKYEVVFTVNARHQATSDQQQDHGWRGFSLGIEYLKCLKEGVHDRFSDSDEPFTFLAFTPLNGSANGALFWRLGPYEEVDTGELRRPRGKSGRFREFVLPPEGTLVVSMQQFEHDEEPKSERDILYRKFREGITGAANKPNKKFLDALGSSVGSAWELKRVEAFGFYRGGTVSAGAMLKGHDGRGAVLKGGSRKRFKLSSENLFSFNDTDNPARWRAAGAVTMPDGAGCVARSDCASDLCIPKNLGESHICCPAEKMKIKWLLFGSQPIATCQ